MSDYWWIDYALLIVGAVIWVFVVKSHDYLMANKGDVDKT